MEIVYFVIIQFFNVVFSTIKSIITIKSKPFAAALVNALYFAFYYYVIKMITEQNLLVVILTAFFTNLIGVYLSKLFLDYLEKDKLWVYDIFVKCDEQKAIKIKEQYEALDCDCIYEEIKKDKYYSIKIFASTKSKSIEVKKLIDQHSAKYYITESK